MNRRAIGPLAVLAGSLAVAPRADAHRLDEYLQATRVSIDVDKIGLEIDLTPGVSVAARVFATIDSDHDGQISNEEADAYAQRVLGSVVLAIDDRPASLTLVGRQFPSLREMTLGTATIRLSSTATLPRVVGLHHLSYVNGHSPDMSVYLANALIPPSDRVQIIEQHRDVLQRSFTVEYRVTGNQTLSRVGWSLAAIGMVGVLVIARRRGRGRP